MPFQGQPLLVDWTPEQSAKIDSAILVANHRLAELDMFSDEGLIDLIDRHPDEALGINTMGHDPNVNEWREGLRNGVDAETLFECVKTGHLWLNFRRVLDYHQEYRDVVNGLYEELEALKPGHKTFNRSANLLVSAPTAIVYYHMDCPVNMLWHIRGKKRVWVYPIQPGVLSDETREAVLWGETTEEITYRPDLDDLAEVFDAEPGQLVTWPQHTPHRVENTEGLNVSLSTEHMTKEACRVNNVFMANRYFRNWFGGGFRNSNPHGLGAAAKEAALRIARRVPALQPKIKTGYEYPVSFAVDPSRDEGFRLLNERPHVEEPVLTAEAACDFEEPVA